MYPKAIYVRPFLWGLAYTEYEYEKFPRSINYHIANKEINYHVQCILMNTQWFST